MTNLETIPAAASDSAISTPAPSAPSPLSRRSPVFYDFQTGKWNHKYLRVCSVYRLLRKQVIGQARALELLAQRHTPSEMKTLRGTVDLWRAHPIKDMLA